MNTTYDKRSLVARSREDFETLYADVRKKEKRLYSLQQVAALPEVSPTHVHCGEWTTRKRSSERLISYLKSKQQHLKVLEIGCGNGWLSNKMATDVDAEVVGIDINKIELSQAKTLWSHKIELDFVYGDIRDNIFKQDHFDIIVFAASVQYFSSLSEILPMALSLLNAGGEIHIIDSKIYRTRELQAAIERTKNYYVKLGYPEMAEHYFHHSWQQLKPFNYTVLIDPSSFINKLLGKNNIFPWIKIKR
jgi:2-polyprenyl-3-methyl-5-hydroxy-6-metoxy-1,4-benzoquinol methylase